MNRTSKATKLGTLVQRHRRAQGRSARDVARSAGIDIATMTRLEKGVYRAPSPLTLKQLSQELGIPLLELFQAAEYVTPYDLVDMAEYVTNRPDLPPAYTEDLHSQYIAKLIEEHGLDYDGPVNAPPPSNN